ncbi:DUF3892 domain-containing protein [Clostridium algidicarnis]|uniref:DUF3892 domain-containing protein n=1 Tax=Clostridium algidicarnis TaxID=37659 RepID=A0ABS6C6B9_9CLOT|nr:DUF3892 domain-containing protein [Clostridium algidicarnis]MBU3221040.1 DUF3892 domain-containing protein [Clostridium algidicarnis]
MADYYIYAVHQEKDVIETVKICISYNEATGPENKSLKTRQNVISDIDESKKSIFTLYKESQVWKLGEMVKVKEISGEKYIKTKANGKRCDNLDNIEQY